MVDVILRNGFHAGEKRDMAFAVAKNLVDSGGAEWSDPNMVARYGKPKPALEKNSKALERNFRVSPPAITSAPSNEGEKINMVTIPQDWRTKHHVVRLSLATRILGRPPGSVPAADQAIEAYLEAQTAESVL